MQILDPQTRCSASLQIISDFHEPRISTASLVCTWWILNLAHPAHIHKTKHVSLTLSAESSLSYKLKFWTPSVLIVRVNTFQLSPKTILLHLFPLTTSYFALRYVVMSEQNVLRMLCSRSSPFIILTKSFHEYTEHSYDI